MMYLNLGMMMSFQEDKISIVKFVSVSLPDDAHTLASRTLFNERSVM